MTYHFEVLIEVAEGALYDINLVGDGSASFTSREFGEVLHESQQFLPPWDRYRRPLRRGAVAGQVLRHLRERGLVVRVRPGRWQAVAS